MLQKMMNAGRLGGVKSRKGFWDYSGGKHEQAIKTRDKMLFEMLKHIHPEQKRADELGVRGLSARNMFHSTRTED